MVFDRHLGERPNQKDRLREDVGVTARDLLDVRIDGGQITEAGVRTNVNVALQYLDAWLGGTGAAAIANLMEDAATAEISRSQLWQWLQHGVHLADGGTFTRELYETIRAEELARIGAGGGHVADAATILDQVVLQPEFEPFMTVVAYSYLG